MQTRMEELKPMFAPRHEIHWIITYNTAKSLIFLCFIKLLSIIKYVYRAISKDISYSV